MNIIFEDICSLDFDPVNRVYKRIGDTSISSSDGILVQKHTGLASKPNFITVLTLDTPEHNYNAEPYSLDRYGSLLANSYNDPITDVLFINDLYIAVNRHYLYTSLDRITWSTFKLPPILDGFNFYRELYSDSLKVYKDKYNSDFISTPTILGDNTWRVPLNFKAYPYRASRGMQRIEGYIGNNGIWHTIDVTNGNIQNEKNLQVVPTTYDINNIIEIRDLNFVCTGYNGDSLDYRGDNIQFVCCTKGWLVWRNPYIGQTYTWDTPFSLIDFTSEADVTSVFHCSFVYDALDGQDATEAKCFSRIVVVLSSGVVNMLSFDGTDFTIPTVITAISGSILYMAEFDQTAFNYDGLRVRPEKHIRFFYTTAGACVAVDASDQTIEPVIYTYSLGISIKGIFPGNLSTSSSFLDSAFIVTTDNEIYSLNPDYISITYVTVLNEDVIAVAANGVYLNVKTKNGLYSINTISQEIDFTAWEIGTLDINGHLSLTGSAGVQFINNEYIYARTDGRVYTTVDFVNWQFRRDFTDFDITRPSFTYCKNTYIVARSVSTGIDFSDDMLSSPSLDISFIHGLGPSFDNYDFLLNNYFFGVNKFYFIYNEILYYNEGSAHQALRLSNITVPAYTDYSSAEYPIYASISFPATLFGPEIHVYVNGKLIGASLYIVHSVTPEEYAAGLREYEHLLLSDIDSSAILLGYASIPNTSLNLDTTPTIRNIRLEIRGKSYLDTSIDFYIHKVETNTSVLYDGSFTQTLTPGITSYTVEHSIGNNSLTEFNVAFKGRFHARTYNYLYSLLNIPHSGISHSLQLYIHKQHVLLAELTQPNNTFYLYDSGTDTFQPCNAAFLANVPNKVNPYDDYLVRNDYISDKVTGILTNGCIVSRIFTNNVWSYSINHSMPNAVEANYIHIISGSTALVLGNNGTLIKYDLVGHNYQSYGFNTQENLITCISFTAIENSLQKRHILVCGTNSVFNLSINSLVTWQDVSIGKTVRKIIIKTFTDTVVDGVLTQRSFELVCVGDTGLIAYSNTNGLNWEILYSGTSHAITDIILFTSISKYVAVGLNSYIAISDDAKNWTKVETGLTFNANTVTIYNDRIYIGADNGKLLTSTDAYYWSFIETNSSSHITQLYAANFKSPQFINIFIWTLAGTMQLDSVNLTTLLPLGSNFYSDISPIGTNSWDICPSEPGGKYKYTITFVTEDSVTFTVEGQMPKEGSLTLSRKYTENDIYRSPSMQLFADEACAIPLTQKIFLASSFTFENDRLTVFFDDTDINVTSIAYLYFENSSLFIAPGGYSYCNPDNYTIRVTGFDTNTSSVYVDGLKATLGDIGTWFDVQESSTSTWVKYLGDVQNYEPDSWGTPLRPKIVGIPDTHFTLQFIKGELVLETTETSMWLKLLSSDKIYDNLMLFSRNIFAGHTYQPYELPSTGFNKHLLHNSNLVSSTYFPLTRCNLGKQLEVSNTDVKRVYLSLNRANYIGQYKLSKQSNILCRGRILNIVSITPLLYDNEPKSEHYYAYTSSYDRPVAIVDVQNEAFIPGIEFAQTQRTGYLYLSTDVYELPGDVSYTAGDTATVLEDTFPGIWVNLRSTSGAFSYLSNKKGCVLFNGLYTSDWHYVSSNHIVIKTYTEYVNAGAGYTITFQVPIVAFEGSASFIVTEKSTLYASTSKQSVYDTELGSLEFNIPSMTSTWDKIVELPRMSTLEPLKINIRRILSGYNASLLPLNILRISGVEYKL